MVYPRGGFMRATQYVMHRMRRLPDKPHRVARGVLAGTFVAFLPIPGGQFLGAWLIALAIRGNILASLLATFLSNPLTTPVIAVFSINLGHWMLGVQEPLTTDAIGAAFSSLGTEFWDNMKSIFTVEKMHWGSMQMFWGTIYLPYLVGSLIPAFISSMVGYYLTIPLVRAYQHARHNRQREKVEKRRLQRLALVTGAEPGSKSGDDDGGRLP
jgi:hypothetical protein